MAISYVKRLAGPYTGDGQSTFTFSFLIFEQADVYVARAESAGAGAASSVLNLGSDYTVQMNQDQDAAPGGTITLTTPLENGQVVVVGSAVDYTQTLDLTNYTRFPPERITTELDRIVVQIQQLVEITGRALIVPATSSETPDQMIFRLLSAQAEAQKHADAAKLSADEAKKSEEQTKKYAEAATIIEPFADEIQTVAGHITQVDQVAGVVADGTLKKAADSIEITTENVRLAQAAQTAAEAANASAQSAKAAASASESAAAHSAQDATTQASAAASSAQSAADSSAQADTKAQAAASSADSAKAYAEQALASANNAQGSATTASGKAQEASASAQAAAQSAKVAAFAFRTTSANLSASGSANVSTLLPQTNIKAGDSVVDADGDVFPITAISGSTFTVGAKTASVRGPQGVKGDTGPRGETGAPLAIKGSYATVEELKQAHPTGALGDAYMVGTHLYSWNGSEWQDVGELKGPQGDTGPQGPAGKDGATGPTGPAGKDGATGPAGKDGAAGVISSVTASVNAATGTPACNVTLGGTPSNRTIALSFTGLKGETGPAPDTSVFLTKTDASKTYLPVGAKAELESSIGTKVSQSELETALKELIVEYGGEVPV